MSAEKRLMDTSTCSGGMANGLASYCALQGLDLTRHARRAGIDPEVLGDRTKRLSIECYSSMLSELARASGDEAFGIHYGQTFRPGDGGPLGFAMINAPSFKVMWELYRSVSDLAIEQTVHFSLYEDRYFVNVNACSPLITDIDTFQDLISVIFVNHIRVHTGENWFPARMEFQRKEPKDRRPWEDFFGPHLQFGRPLARNYILIEDIERGNPHADARLFEYLSDDLIKRHDAYMASHDLISRVRRVVAYNLQIGRGDLSSVASDMAMSRRSLQRHLAERGLAFGGLVHEVRMGIAQSLLARPDLTMNEIAERCGYTSIAAFCRAMKRTEGAGPATLRKGILPK